MKKSRFTEEQVAAAVRQAESGIPVVEICRRLGVSEVTFYRWKKQFAGMGISELRKLRLTHTLKPPYVAFMLNMTEIC